MSPSALHRPLKPSRWRDRLMVGAFLFSLLGVIWVPLTSGDSVLNTERWLAALNRAGTLPAGTTILIQPPWRDDVLDAIESAGLPKGTSASTALARAHGSWPGPVLLLADTAQPLPWSLRKHLAVLPADKISIEDGLLVAHLGLSDGPSAAASPLLDHRIAGARVRVRINQGTQGKQDFACAYDPARQRHLCPELPEWIWVGDYSMVTAGKRDRCLWAHPVKKGSLFIAFENVLLTESLELRHALTDGAVRNGGSMVEVIVRVDGKIAGRSRRSNAPGFARHRIATTAGKRATIEFEITAKTDGARHHCFSARLLESKTAPKVKP